MDSPPDEPAIRPLPHEPAIAGGRSRGWWPWLAVAAGAAGLAAGLLLGLAAGSDREPAPTPGGTLSDLPPDLAAPGFVERTTTTSSVPPTPTTTTTTTTTLADPEPPPTLGAMVPGLDGTMLLAFPDGVDEVWRWRVDDPFPERRPLPPGTVDAAFDASGGWTAALAVPDNAIRTGGGLFLAGPDLEFQPFETGVVAFRWHLTGPGHLAFTKVALDGSLELWTTRIPGPAEETRRVARLDATEPRDNLFLVGWGDWGFALVGGAHEQGGAVRLVTMDPDGGFVAELEADIVAVATDGTMLVSRGRAHDGSPIDLGLTTPELGEPSPVDWAARWPTVWASDAARLATTAATGLGAVLQIHGTGAFESVLDTPQAYTVGWAPGDRFVVLWAEGVRTRFSTDPGEPRRAREARRPALMFFDVHDRSVTAIATGEIPSDVAFRVAS